MIQMSSSCRGTFYRQPEHGVWTITNGVQLSFPDEVQVNGVLFRRAKWKEAKPGVVEQYRQAVERSSRHLLVSGDGRWIIDHVDDINPDMGDATAPMRHFVADHPLGQGLVALALVAGAVLVIAGLAGGLKS
jgi:hypothetical protein